MPFRWHRSRCSCHRNPRCNSAGVSVERDHQSRTKNVPRKVPSTEPLRLLALSFRPFVAIGEGTKLPISQQRKDSDCCCRLDALGPLDSARGQIKDGTETEDGKPECREIVVQEQLAVHEVERQVVQSPSNDKESANLIVGLHDRWEH